MKIHRKITFKAKETANEKKKTVIKENLLCLRSRNVATVTDVEQGGGKIRG